MMKSLSLVGFLGSVALAALSWWNIAAITFCSSALLLWLVSLEKPKASVMICIASVMFLGGLGAWLTFEFWSPNILAALVGGLLLSSVGFLSLLAATLLLIPLYADLALEGRKVPWQRLIAYALRWLPFSVLTRAFPETLQVIDHGRQVFPDDENFQTLGPGFLVVKAGNAVVLERTGAITRVEGGGFFLTEPFESVKAIVSLKPMVKEVCFEDVLSRDSVGVRMTVRCRFGVKRANGCLNPLNVFPLRVSAVLKAAFEVEDWQAATLSRLDSLLREIVAGYSLDQLNDPLAESSAIPGSREVIASELRRRLTAEAQHWGVELLELSIGEIDIPEEAADQIRSLHEAHWKRLFEKFEAETRLIVNDLIATDEANALRVKGEAEAAVKEALARSEASAIRVKGEADAMVKELLARIEVAVRADTLDRFLAAIVPDGKKPDKELVTRYIDALSTFTLNLRSGDAMAIQTIKVMEKLAENPNAQIILAPDGVTRVLSITGNGNAHMPELALPVREARLEGAPAQSGNGQHGA